MILTDSQAVRKWYKTLNRGSLWAHPFDSPYALRRRFLVANPNINLTHLTHIEPSLERMRVMDSCVPGQAIRQCPQCANHLFHASIYQLRALALCPIHHCELTLSCPQCHREWGKRPVTKRAWACTQCGRLPREALAQTQLKRRHYRKIGWITRWIERCETRKKSGYYPPLLDIHTLINPRYSIDQPSFFNPQLENHFNVAFESQRTGGVDNSRLRSLNIVTHDEALKSRCSRIRPWQIRPEPFHKRDLHAIDDAWLLAKESEMVTRIAMAARRILKWQQKTLGFDHCLVWSDVKYLRPEAVQEGLHPCPLCMAFSFWCSAITFKFTNVSRAWKPSEYELCRLVHYYRYPNIPAGVFIKDRRENAYRPSGNFERWLFLRSSDNAFLELVQLALWIFERTADESVRFNTMKFSDAAHAFRKSSFPSQIMEVRLQGDQLTALYWPRSPLLDIDLDRNALHRIKHCTVDSCSAYDFNYALEPDPKKVNQLHITQLLKDPELPPNALFPWLAQTVYAYQDRWQTQYDIEVVSGLSNHEDTENYWSIHGVDNEIDLAGTGNRNTTNR